MEKKATFRDNSIYYSLLGEGLAVFFLHGFGEDKSIWNNLAPYFSEKYKIILVDLPGCGKSPMPKNEPLTIADYADCIHAISKQEALQKYVIVGHSMGGYVALASLKKYPQELIAIGLFHSNIYSDQPTKIASRTKSIEFIRTNGVDSFLQISIPPLFHNPTSRKRYLNQLTNQHFENEICIQQYQTIMNRTDSLTEIKHSNIPVLFIIGKHDTTISFDEALSQLIYPNETHVAILRDSGHMGMLEETEKSIQIINNFLTHISSRVI